MFMLTRYSFACILLLGSSLLKAQDIHFSQTLMTPLLLNPAQAGSFSRMRVVTNQRSQWKSIVSPYTTSMVSFDMAVDQGNKGNKKGKLAFGSLVFYDKAGEARLRTFQANVYFAYHLKIARNNYLGAGIYGGFLQHQLDYSGLQWMNQFDGTGFNPSLPSNEPPLNNIRGTADFGAGINYSFKKGERYMSANDHKRLDAGLSVSHINRPVNSFYTSTERLDMKFTGYLSGIIGKQNSRFASLPQLIYMKQGAHAELILGTLLRYEVKEAPRHTNFVQASAISLGVHYRNKDAFIASVLIEISKFAIGLSYDITASKLNEGSGRPGAFEVSLRFLKPNPLSTHTVN